VPASDAIARRARIGDKQPCCGHRVLWLRSRGGSHPSAGASGQTGTWRPASGTDSQGPGHPATACALRRARPDRVGIGRRSLASSPSGSGHGGSRRMTVREGEAGASFGLQSRSSWTTPERLAGDSPTTSPQCARRSRSIQPRVAVPRPSLRETCMPIRSRRSLRIRSPRAVPAAAGSFVSPHGDHA
jgi:hypothetical protein